jgi:hypothetical protein
MTTIPPARPGEAPPPQRGLTREERGRDVSEAQAETEAATSKWKQFPMTLQEYAATGRWRTRRNSGLPLQPLGGSGRSRCVADDPTLSRQAVQATVTTDKPIDQVLGPPGLGLHELINTTGPVAGLRGGSGQRHHLDGRSGRHQLWR